jgi:GGDEF domain-containing protein
MSGDSKPRVLLAGPDASLATFLTLLPPAGWDVASASSLEQACFLQEARPCEVVVVEGGLAGPGWSEGLARLARLALAPIVLVADAAPEILLEGLRQGAAWLPADVARRHPDIFLAHLDRAAALGAERHRARITAAQLRNSHARIDRLLGLLWEAVPGEGPARWFSQRHMLDRLDEEVARARRTGRPLALALGELRAESGDRLDPRQLQRLGGWLARQIGAHKRRSDVAGQYGPGGFMLLLPQATPEEAAGACRRLDGLLRHEAHEDLPAVHACFGLAYVPGDEPAVQALLRRAEERLEQAGDGPHVPGSLEA